MAFTMGASDPVDQGQRARFDRDHPGTGAPGADARADGPDAISNVLAGEVDAQVVFDLAR
jgi:hypothetical protein